MQSVFDRITAVAVRIHDVSSHRRVKRGLPTRHPMRNDRATFLSLCWNINCHGRSEVETICTCFHEITVQDNGVTVWCYKVKFWYYHPWYLRRENAALLWQTNAYRDY